MTTTIQRDFPTWTVLVDGQVRFSGLWRRSTAESLAASINTPLPPKVRRHRFAHLIFAAALVIAQHHDLPEKVHPVHRLPAASAAV